MAASPVLLTSPPNYTGVIGATPSGTVYAVVPGQTVTVQAIDVQYLLNRGFNIAPPPASGGSNISAILVESGSSVKISAMSNAASLTGTELVPVVQSGGDVQSTTAAIAALATGKALSGPTICAGATQAITADTYVLTNNTTRTTTISGATSQVVSGSVTYTLYINGTPITGLTSIAENQTSPTTHNASAANTVSAGNVISITVSGTGLGFSCTLNYSP